MVLFLIHWVTNGDKKSHGNTASQGINAAKGGMGRNKKVILIKSASDGGNANRKFLIHFTPLFLSAVDFTDEFSGAGSIVARKGGQFFTHRMRLQNIQKNFYC